VGAADAAAAARGRQLSAVAVRGLRFRYRRSPSWVLDGIELEIPTGARCLVIGANGAGKTTLLRVLGGKHMVPREVVQVLGASAFHDTWLAGDVEMLGGNFPFEVDLEVQTLLDHVPARDHDRRDRLVELLGVDPGWHMHAVSDGQRRRVQLLLGLVRPRRLLLLDEVTTDLDLLARQDLLAFLREESEGRGATILYATHIFDTLDEWATHLVYLVAGRVHTFARLDELVELADERARTTTPLLHVVEAWLRRDTRK
jgi:CCR4-NOT complex subunit CAF16